MSSGLLAQAEMFRDRDTHWSSSVEVPAQPHENCETVVCRMRADSAWWWEKLIPVLRAIRIT